MTVSTTLTLDPEARRKLGQVYRFILSLERREKQAASRETVGGQTRPAAIVEAADRQRDHQTEV